MCLCGALCNQWKLKKCADPLLSFFKLDTSTEQAQRRPMKLLRSNSMEARMLARVTVEGPCKFKGPPKDSLPYFIEYNALTSIVRTWISQWFLEKNILFLFFKNNFARINHCKYIHHKSHHKPLLSYLSCIVQGIFQHHF